MPGSRLFPLLLAAGTLMAQTPAAITATGNASISVSPDQAQVSVGVITSAATAQDAAQKNATQTAAVIDAVKAVLGPSGTIQTIGYSVYPRYGIAQAGQDAPIVGYYASNTLQVTTNDLSLTGRLIDSANQAGANSVSGITFGLQNSDPVRQQALTLAAKQALAHVAAIAAGLRATTGIVLGAQEGSNVSPVVSAGVAAASTPTPVETGTVSVSATVTVSVQIVQ